MSNAKPPVDRKLLRASVFCLICVAVALFLFALPIPSVNDVKIVRKAESARASISIVGPSTIDTVSKCDTDRRTVPTMLSDLTGQRVNDLSVGGQHLSDSINLSAASGRDPWVTDVVLPLAEPMIDDWTTPPYRQLLFYKVVMPDFRVYSAANLTDFWSGLSNQTRRIERGYSFEGKIYPDYRVLSAGVFSHEKSLAACPEVLTHDLAFTRSYFWWTQVASQRNASLPGLISDLQVELRRKGRRLHVVLLPVNMTLLGQFDPSWPTKVRAEQREFVDDLAKQGVRALDLSNSFAPDEFTTQWCACIHLTQKGRIHLVGAIASFMHGENYPPPRSGADLADPALPANMRR